MIFLAGRGLAFRGREEISSIHDWNFLGIMEIIAQFRTFLQDYFKIFGNPGSGKR